MLKGTPEREGRRRLESDDVYIFLCVLRCVGDGPVEDPTARKRMKGTSRCEEPPPHPSLKKAPCRTNAEHILVQHAEHVLVCVQERWHQREREATYRRAGFGEVRKGTSAAEAVRSEFLEACLLAVVYTRACMCECEAL